MHSVRNGLDKVIFSIKVNTLEEPLFIMNYSLKRNTLEGIINFSLKRNTIEEPLLIIH